MAERGLENIAIELRCIAATTAVLSQAFVDGGSPAPELMESTLYGLSLQLEKLSEEVSSLEAKRLKEIRKVGMDYAAQR